jgi:hypothetical protein
MIVAVQTGFSLARCQVSNCKYDAQNPDPARTFVESTTNPMTHGATNLCAGIRPRRRGRSCACVMRKAAVIFDAKLEA